LSKTEALIRLSGRIRYRRNTARAFRLSSKLYNHTVRRVSRQSLLPTEFPDDFHIGKFWSWTGRAAKPTADSLRQAQGKPHRLAARFGMTMLLGKRSLRHATVWSSAGNWTPLSARTLLRQAFCDSPDGRQKIEKRSFGGPCFEGTLRNCLPSESSPVAGTIENLICSLET
jgi:hypothetical protein